MSDPLDTIATPTGTKVEIITVVSHKPVKSCRLWSRYIEDKLPSKLSRDRILYPRDSLTVHLHPGTVVFTAETIIVRVIPPWWLRLWWRIKYGGVWVG